MKRKFAIALAMALSLSLACTACSGSGGGSAESQPQGGTTSSTAKSFNLKLAGIKTEDDPATLAMNRFAEVLAEDPDLNISVTTYPNSVLGSSNDMLSGMPTGLTDLFYNTLSCYPWLEGAQKFNAVTAPFLWDSQEEFQAFLDSDTAQQWFEEAAQATGVRVLAARGELPPPAADSQRPGGKCR